MQLTVLALALSTASAFVVPAPAAAAARAPATKDDVRPLRERRPARPFWGLWRRPPRRLAAPRPGARPRGRGPSTPARPAPTRRP
ncbi:hypothetical protein M885DRAFT_538646 [Pelagophyceae sp. CCMP2097]|nr:hypothetical protein M885DRAFT_538646 [Pelagophyceae sp. CCMP2097]